MFFHTSVSHAAEWQQVSSALQDFSEYSGQSQRCCNLIGLDSSSDFQLFPSPFQFFWGPFQVRQLQLVPPSPGCFFFLIFLQDPNICLFFHFLFIFTLWSTRTAKSLKTVSSFFLLINIRSRLLVGMKWSVCIAKISFSWGDSGLWIYHLVVWSNFNLLHNSQWITQSCLVLYCFGAILLYSLIV